MTWDRSKGRPEPIRALNRIREIDNGEPLVELAQYAPSVVVLRESVIPFLRLKVAQMLEAAAQSLPAGYRIGVVDAWRPFLRQQQIYDWMWANVNAAFPDMPYASKRRKVCRFVAPVDQKAPPGHTTGAAVDVYLINSAGETLDTTSPFTRLRSAPTYTYGLTETALKHRMMLVEAMLGSGFSNCRDEWWHYSYGDAGWAVRMGEPECCYGRIDRPQETYQAEMDAWLDVVKDRPNPFLEAEKGSHL